MEQNIEYRPEIDPYQSTNLWEKNQRQVNRAKIVFSTNGAVTPGHPCAVNK